MGIKETDCASANDGMQHRLSDTWTEAYNRDFSEMAEDGVDNTSSHVTNAIHPSSTGTLVNGLLKKANGLSESLANMGGGGGGGSGLEQKIQELKAEKEASEIKKCHLSIHNDQDSPLDFSVKRRSSFSGSLTDDSQASSCSPNHVADYSAVSPPQDTHSGLRADLGNKRGTPSPGNMDEEMPSNHENADAPSANNLPPLINGMSLFPQLQANLMSNNSALNTFSQIAAAANFMDPRNRKNNRPFKAYPKEALQMPLGFFGMPGVNPAVLLQSIESGIFSGMNSEELVNLYKQQMRFGNETQVSPSEKTSPGPQMSPPDMNHKHHHHPQSLHQQQNQQQQQPFQHHPQPQSPLAHQVEQPLHPMPNSPPRQPSSPQAPMMGCQSPASHPASRGQEYHIKSSSSSSSPSFPAPPLPPHSSSISASLVSSTSSSHHQSHSRRRPRSLPDEQKDAAYWERRRKNNDAAKRSRDARRAKEDEIAIRAALLEQENLKLRVEVAALKTETARLRCLLYNS